MEDWGAVEDLLVGCVVFGENQVMICYVCYVNVNRSAVYVCFWPTGLIDAKTLCLKRPENTCTRLYPFEIRWPFRHDAATNETRLREAEAEVSSSPRNEERPCASLFFP